MNAIATKLQVTAAAAAIAAGAAFAPAVSNAAPAVQISAAPVETTIANLAEAPGDFTWWFQVTSVQIAASLTRFGTYWADSQIARYEADLTRNPNSIFAGYWQRRIDQLETRRAAFGQLSLSACRDGQGIVAAPMARSLGAPAERRSSQNSQFIRLKPACRLVDVQASTMYRNFLSAISSATPARSELCSR